MSLEINNAKVGDLKDVVELHIDRFNCFFLTTLGPHLLKSYYSAFLNDKDFGFLLVAKELGEVVGFAAVAFESKGAMKRIIRIKFWSIIFSLIPVVFKSPKLIIRLMNRFVRGKKNSVQGPELLSIAAKPNSSGIGSMLLNQTEKRLQVSGLNCVSLTTDKLNNAKVIRFYEKNGFFSLGEFETTENRVMLRMQKII